MAMGENVWALLPEGSCTREAAGVFRGSGKLSLHVQLSVFNNKAVKEAGTAGCLSGTEDKDNGVTNKGLSFSPVMSSGELCIKKLWKRKAPWWGWGTEKKQGMCWP